MQYPCDVPQIEAESLHFNHNLMWCTETKQQKLCQCPNTYGPNCLVKCLTVSAMSALEIQARNQVQLSLICFDWTGLLIQVSSTWYRSLPILSDAENSCETA